MSKIDNGGPAFPLHPDLAERLGCINSTSDAGISVRDYFAAKAMQASLGMNDVNQFSFAQHAHYAYSVADAMLAEREKSK